MRRSTILGGSALLSALGALGIGAGTVAWRRAGTIDAVAPAKADEWVNWSGNQRCAPAQQVAPATIAGLQEMIRTAPGPMRVVGAGHSFTPLVNTDAVLLSLENLTDEPLPVTMPTAADGSVRIWLPAGQTLRELSATLADRGLAFANLGDIDVQTLGGAIATATHGTGQGLRCLSGDVTGVRLLTADGESRTATVEDNPDLVAAAAVSLGVLGVITAIQMRVVPAHRLERRTWSEALPDLLRHAHELWATHRNFEFFYVPFSGHCVAISHDVSTAEPSGAKHSADRDGLIDLKRARDLLQWNPSLRRWVIAREVAALPDDHVVGPSWELLASERDVPFTELEYHLPADTALDTLRLLIDAVESTHPEVFFPIEVRQTAGDDHWLSPFHGANRISIAVHAFAHDDHDWLFTTAEPILRDGGGRPHWGKLHSLTAADVTALYPAAERFRAIRRDLDPDGRFLNEHTRALNL